MLSLDIVSFALSPYPIAMVVYTSSLSLVELRYQCQPQAAGVRVGNYLPKIMPPIQKYCQNECDTPGLRTYETRKRSRAAICMYMYNRHIHTYIQVLMYTYSCSEDGGAVAELLAGHDSHCGNSAVLNRFYFSIS
jgi:hypothetical protein